MSPERLTAMADDIYEDLDFEADLRIDVNNLADEWLRMPALVQKYGKLAANASHKKERLKAKTDWIKAKLDFDIRKDPEAYDNIPTDPKSGKPKLTETVVANAVVMDLNYQEVINQKVDAIYEHASMAVLMDTMRSKATALENITKLALAGWFSEKPMNITNDVSCIAEYATYEEKARIQQVENKGRRLIKRKTTED
jgi:hypothetical protein